MSFLSTKTGQFVYFDEQLGHPDWKAKRVLDFGGNRGNLLAGHDELAHEKYWCIDVSREAIASGRAAFPRAHWIHYDRYNFEFNPQGIEGLPIPDAGQPFDLILAYSVFTHTSRSEMLEMIEQLRGMLADNGVLAFTFLDPQWLPCDASPWPGSNLDWRLHIRKRINPRVDVDALLGGARGAQWLTLVNDDELYVDDQLERAHDVNDRRAYITFCDPRYMQAMFPEALILPPVSPERQHCCVIPR